MPTYEYACGSCGEHLEIVQSFRDDPLTECPACGGPLRKVFGSIGVVFKGSGFYKTDSRPSGKSSSSSSSDSSSSSTASASDKSSSDSSSSASTGPSGGSTGSSSTSGSSSSSSGSGSGSAAAAS